MRRLLPLAAAVWALASCTPGREPAPEPAHSREGWVELRIADPDVPADPVSLAGGAPVPPPCHLEVELSGRVAVSEALSPSGAFPPYAVDESFRFGAPAGDHVTTVVYAGCRTYQDQLDSVEATLRIPVRAGQVTWLRFDGATLEARTPPGSFAPPAY